MSLVSTNGTVSSSAPLAAWAMRSVGVPRAGARVVATVRGLKRTALHELRGTAVTNMAIAFPPVGLDSK
jgi:hypothetical protein